MNAATLEILWLDDRSAVPLSELSRCSGLSEDELRELVDYGALAPVDPERLLFSGDCIVSVRTARRLREDFDLDSFSVAMMLGYLDRIHSLEGELRKLRAQTPGVPKAP